VRPPFPRSRPARVGAAGFALAVLLAMTARGQGTAGDASSLARYVPRDKLVFYFEYDGLDAHADAWRKTAAYKILNTTTTGVMLEDLFVQLVGRIPGARYTGPETLAMLKHAARSGFVFAMGGEIGKEKPDYTVFAVRDAFKNKDVRPVFARYLQTLNAPNTKAQAVVRVGHKVISGTTGTSTYTWWVEETRKDDLVLVFASPESADAILETLDGKRPNAVAHPLRAELAKPQGGFVPTGLMFLDPVALRTEKIPASLGLSEITRLDYRWGFQDDALMTVARISSPSPRKGVLGLLDGPTFDKGKLPPLPESLTGYTVTSVDLRTTLDKLVALAKPFRPDAEDRVNQAVDAIKAKTKLRLRLREDVLSHLGPKVAWYVLPTKPGATAAPLAPSMMGMMMAGAGLDQVPKLAIVFDLDDPAAFGKVLDELMAFANRELKAQMARQMGGGDLPNRVARNRAASMPSFEFRLMPGEAKTYVLTVPTEMANVIPSTLRPTIRVGPKHVVVAVSSDVARQALEAKGSWTPPTELAGAFLGLSGKLKVLSVDDPRDTTPAVLAALPARIQAAINAAILKAQPPSGGPAGSPGPTAPGGPAVPGGPTAPGGSGGSAVPGSPAIPGGSGGSAVPGSPAIPGGLAVPGGPAVAGGSAAPAPNAPPGGPQMLVLQVDAAKLPSAEAVRALLFPSVTSAEVTEEGLRIVVRQAFPNLGNPSQMGMFSGMIASARAGARKVPGPSPGPSPGPNNAPPKPGPGSRGPGRE